MVEQSVQQSDLKELVLIEERLIESEDSELFR